MSDFDLSLIREFRSRPAFYDRSSPLFKDKALNAQAWQEISNILGYDVALLKDRMLQLRNRYNLEKRRLEQLAEDNPGRYVTSPWALYEHLGFLSGHIRSRRSFKRMLPRHTSNEMSSLSGGGGGIKMSSPTPLDVAYSATPLANGMLTVKLEHTSDAESESQSDNDATGAGGGGGGGGETGDEDGTAAPETLINDKKAATVAPLINLRNIKTNSSSNSGNHNNNGNPIATAILRPPKQQQQPPPPPPHIRIRKMESMRRIIPKHTNINANNTNNYNSNNIAKISVGDVGAATLTVPEKKRCLNAREQKYEAFGQFVASSLEEMPKEQALLLVERFTSEVVRVLIEKNVNDDGKMTKATSVTATNLTNNYSNKNNSNNSTADEFQRPHLPHQRKAAN